MAGNGAAGNRGGADGAAAMWVPAHLAGAAADAPPAAGAAAPGTPRRLARAAAGLLDLLVPPACPVCRRPVADAGGLCGPCFSQLVAIDRPLCDRLGLPLVHDPFGVGLSREAVNAPPPWDRARAAVVYGAIAGRIVHALKYRDRLETAGLMARMMARAGADLFDGEALMAPVPLHPRRLIARRYNQSALIAAAVYRHLLRIDGHGGRTPTPMPTLLRRVRPTRRQVGLSAAARGANVADAFAVPAPSTVAGRRVIVVDDVLTSGATLAAVTQALREAGASRVDILVFARVVAGTAEPT